MINVTPGEMEIILSILAEFVPGCEVRVFGSRIKESCKPYSDIDLAIVGRERLEQSLMFAMREKFQESELTFRVDLLDWHALSPEFQAVIEKEYQVIVPQS